MVSKRSNFRDGLAPPANVILNSISNKTHIHVVVQDKAFHLAGPKM